MHSHDKYWSDLNTPSSKRVKSHRFLLAHPGISQANMLGYFVLPIFASIAHGFVASSDATAPIVDLGYAQYQGFFDVQTNITNFLGIRYAAPPIGESISMLDRYRPDCDYPCRELEVSSTSTSGPRVWCATCNAEP